jgi:hypothetical protein
VRELFVAAALVACSAPSPDTTSTTPPVQTAIAENATTVEVLGPEQRLAKPRALAFNPLRPDELWILNARDNSVVLVYGTGSESPSFERRHDPGADHFLHKPSAIAFGADKTSFGSVGTFATCGESRNENGIEGSTDFMGPTLWTSDLAIFARKNPEGLGSHIDMLHEAPLCMGIAHERDNVYWATNGLTNSIVRFDFGVDHNVGKDDHSDGSAKEYARGQLKYVEGVPSHMVVHNGFVYVADTGHGRIAKLDINSGTPAGKLTAPEPLRGGAVVMNGATLVDVVPPGTLTAPSGLTLRENVLYVSDNANGRISAFDLEGKKLASFDTGLAGGAIAGLAFGPDGRLYFADMNDSRIMRVER